MAVNFFYSTVLKNSFQQYLEDYEVTWATGDGAHFEATSGSTPSDEDIYHVVVDPGHTGDSAFIEYSLNCFLQEGGAGVGTCKWQIKGSGGAWDDLETGIDTNGIYSRLAGVYTSVLTMPFEIRFLANHDANTVIFSDWMGYRGACTVSVFGTI